MTRQGDDILVVDAEADLVPTVEEHRPSHVLVGREALVAPVTALLKAADLDVPVSAPHLRVETTYVGGRAIRQSKLLTVCLIVAICIIIWLVWKLER